MLFPVVMSPIVLQDAIFLPLVPMKGSRFSGVLPPESLDRCLLILETAVDREGDRQVLIHYELRPEISPVRSSA